MSLYIKDLAQERSVPVAPFQQRNDEVGEIAKAVEIIRNKTESRKKIEEALRKSQESLAEAQKIAHIGNWWLNMKTGELYWSDEIHRSPLMTRI